MCGIAGILSDKLGSDKSLNILNQILSSISHRGPDDKGVYNNLKNLFLGHQRLSILDLSNSGSQPMHSENNQYVITYNGEVYNFRELKNNIQNCNFKGSSDTEVIIQTIQNIGVYEALKRFNGMFSFGLEDKKENVFYLVRDRLGVKPLFYTVQPWGIAFCSELKGMSILKKNSLIDDCIENQSIQDYFNFGYIRNPYTIYKGIYKLYPGSIIKFPLEDLSNIHSTFSPLINGNKISPQKFWDIYSFLDNQDFSKIKYETLIDEVDTLITDSVSLRFESDVPVGIFLSGGIDSSLITAIATKKLNKNIEAYTISFSESHFDESKDSSELCKYLGINNKIVQVNESDVLGIILNENIYDEPLADQSFIPTYLLSKFASNSIKVVLTGDGGDEIFAGYNRYIWTEKIFSKLKYINNDLKDLINKNVLRLSPKVINFITESLKVFFPYSLTLNSPSEKLQKFTSVFKENDILIFYENLVKIFDNSILINPSFNTETLRNIDLRKELLSSTITAMQMYDILTYLPENILVKLDRASMLNSLEARGPLLDFRLVDYGLNLKNKFKIKNSKGKIILRDVLKKYLTDEFINKPKKGFSVPISKWLKFELKEWASDLIYGFQDSFINTEEIRRLFDEHINEKKDNSTKIWTSLMYIDWIKKNRI